MLRYFWNSNKVFSIRWRAQKQNNAEKRQATKMKTRNLWRKVAHFWSRQTNEPVSIMKEEKFCIHWWLKWVVMIWERRIDQNLTNAQTPSSTWRANITNLLLLSSAPLATVVFFSTCYRHFSKCETTFAVVRQNVTNENDFQRARKVFALAPKLKSVHERMVKVRNSK